MLKKLFLCFCMTGLIGTLSAQSIRTDSLTTGTNDFSVSTGDGFWGPGEVPVSTGDGPFYPPADEKRFSSQWKQKTSMLASHKRYPSYFVISDFTASIGIGYNGLVHKLNDLSIPEGLEPLEQGKSVNFNVNLISMDLVSLRHFALSMGLGFECNNFQFRQGLLPNVSDAGVVIAEQGDIDRGIKKTKLKTTYLTIPLTVSWRIVNGARIYAGVIGGLNIASKTKTKYDGGGKHKDYFSAVPRLRYGYLIGADYKYIGIYARYYPESIFKEGPKTSVASIGVSLNLFR